ncbi:MAG: RHS repeat-associated core domain-containing protein, partial [Bdellovibrionota bacterium]
VTLDRTYDANGNETSLTSNWGDFTYAYDSLDRLTRITNPYAQTVTFTNDAVGRRTAMGYPNGTSVSYGFDAAGQIAQIVHRKTSDQSVIAFANYTHDASGNRTVITDAHGTHTYSYDPLNRLTSASHPGTSTLPVKEEVFDYDNIGSRLADALRSNYSYDAANRIVSDSSFTYTTNANGNVATRTSRASGFVETFIYDSGSRMVEVDGPSGVIATYKHDPLGRRVEKNVGGTITRYVYDGQNILATLDASNNLIALFTNGPGIDSPLIMRRGGQDYFFHADALGSVVALTNSNGNIVETYEYQWFGRAVVRDAQDGLHGESTVGNPFLFTSRELDSETGFYFYRARHLDPGSGRFLQEDAIPSVNQFIYADNNPLLMSDPLGLCPSALGQLGDATLNTIGGLGNGFSLGGIGSANGFYKTDSVAYQVGSVVGYGATVGILAAGIGAAYLGTETFLLGRSAYELLEKGKDYQIRETNVTATNALENLLANGFSIVSQSPGSKGGTVTLLRNERFIYTIYQS